jgi:ParB family transcriptional regulator, chromosome partitioning protein
MSKRKVLGKGLNALFPDMAAVMEGGTQEGTLFRCPIEAINPNPYQPRKAFDPEKIEELAASMQSSGVIQPLVVRKGSNGYELIAGERRWRAAIKAGLQEVPVVVKDVPDDQVLRLSLIENLQRENLNPIEEADAYRRLVEEFNLSQENVGEIVGKDRSTIANTLRLLKLPEKVRADLAVGRISSGHARALLAIEVNAKRLSAHKEIIKRDLSVRQAEELVKKLKHDRLATPAKRELPELRAIRESLQRDLGTRVRIIRRGNKGKIEVYFFSNEDLTRILEKIQGGM